jgi:photosystem II stability/assembly factor-like uncharacterized protein
MFTHIFALMLWLQPFLITQPATSLVFRSADGGETWQDISTGLPGDLPVGNVAFLDNELLLAAESGLYRRENSRWEKDHFPNPPIYGFLPGHSAYAYSDKGIVKKLPGSGIWVPVFRELKWEAIFTVLENPDGSTLLGCDSGIIKMEKGGKNWKKVFSESWANHLVAVDGALIATGSKGLLRSTDQGENWSWALTSEGLALKTRLVEDGVVAITIGTSQAPEPIVNRLLLSTDTGKSWNLIDKNLPSARKIYDVEQASGYLFCSLDAGVFRSSDGGQTWELVLSSQGEGRFELTVSGQSVIAAWAAGLDGC